MSGIVEDVNRERSRFEQIKRFAILPRDFAMEQGEVTPTLKLKRRVVLEHFADEVEGLYSSAGSESAGGPDRRSRGGRIPGRRWRSPRLPRGHTPLQAVDHARRIAAGGRLRRPGGHVRSTGAPR